MERYLIGLDFDETLFHTFRPSPNGIDVKVATRKALADIFGDDLDNVFRSVIDFQDTPSQIVTRALRWDMSRHNGRGTDLIGRARNFFESERIELNPFIPESRIGEVVWNSLTPETTITQMLVGQKLKYFVDEIGRSNGDGPWPQPISGVLDFFEAVSIVKEEGAPVDLAIISSGHELFIRKTLEVYGVSPPDILVTDDDIRPMKYPDDPERKYKPGQVSLALTHLRWAHLQGLVDGGGDLIHSEVVSLKPRMMYIGDDIYRDLGLARDAHIHGIVVPLSMTWEKIADLLLKGGSKFDGRAISEIFPIRND